MLFRDGDFDLIVPSYRRACSRWPTANGLQKHYELLSRYDLESPGVVEAVKSFVESVCVTILADFRAPLPSSRPSLTELFRAALTPLGLQNTRSGSTVDRLLSAFSRLADAVSDVRNEFGTLAHGKDGFINALNRDENRALLHAGDAILAILLNALEGVSPDLASTREPYERFQVFNERIDRSIEVSAEVEYDQAGLPVVLVTVDASREEAIELRIEPSRLLFMIDREAFVEMLNASDVTRYSDGEAQEATESLVSASQTFIERRPSNQVFLSVDYDGPLSRLKADLRKFLDAESVRPSSASDGRKLVPSLLSTIEANMILDIWKSSVAQARLTLTIRSVFRAFHVEDADELASKTVTWLRVHAAEIGSNSEPS